MMMNTVYIDQNDNPIVSIDGDLAILSVEDHLETLEPLAALIAASSPTGLFVYYWQTGAVLPVARVDEEAPVR